MTSAIARACVLVLLGAAVVAGTGAVLARSLIPAHLDDRVVTVEWVSETAFSLKTLRFEDGREVVVDRSVGELVEPSSLLEKDAWSRRLLVDGTPVSLEPEGDFWRLVVVDLVAVAFVVALLVGRPRRPPAAAPERGDRGG